MTDERILAQIYGEIASLKRQAEQKVESLAYQHVGSGAPGHAASEGVFYWDYTANNLYVNSDGSTTWQSIGGSVAGAHVLLSATHTDTTAASVTRGALVIGLGASPTWTRRDHPGDINYYLRSNAADPDWTSDLTMAAGAYVGRTGDVRVEFDSAAGQLDLILGDAAGSDEVRVVDSGGVAVVTADSDGNLYAAGVANFHAAGIRTIHSEANVTSPPSDAELDAAFGTPAVVGEGFIGLLDDNNAGTAGYMVFSLGGFWWYEVATKAT